MNIFGYFSEPDQTVPEYDPGLDTICPLCMFPLSPLVVTISLMKPGDSRSYFYRVCKKCRVSATDEDMSILESSLIDSI